MQNAQPRFGLHTESGMLHDYVTGRVVDPVVGTVTDSDGTWDLPLVVTLITAGKTIESAYTPNLLTDKEAELNRARKKLKWAQGELDKVNQANADFQAGTPPVVDDKVTKADADFQADGGNSGSNGQ